MRASRLVSMLLLVQNRGQLTAAAIARELEVSERTVYRDVEALSAAGIPIYAERGPHGGVRLVEGYRTRLTGMTEDEARALFLSGLPGPAAELGLGTVMTAARLKVLAALPTELRARATRLVERFYLDAAAWFAPDDDVPHLPVLAEAVWESRLVGVTYDRGDELSARTLEPLGLVLKAGAWYFVARVGSDFRTYRAANVQRLTTLDESFERPKDFDLGAHWRRELERFEAELERETATVRVSEKGLGRIVRIGPGARRAAENAIPGPDGWREAVIPIEGVDHAAGLMIGMGPEIEVLAPRALRARLAELAGEIAALNAAS